MEVMAWNIQNFSNNKLGVAAVQACIMSTIYAPAPGGAMFPDLLVVIEPCARPTNIGAVPVTSGAVGLAALLVLLQAQDANWRAVPPVCLGAAGRAEAIGVFYRQNILTFTGPHVWSNYFPVPAAQLGGVTTAPWTAEFYAGPPVAAVYPAPWNAAPLAAAGAPAPQIFFPNAANTGFIQFPQADFRRPLRTTFTIIATGGTLDLWSFHTSPSVIMGVNQAVAAMVNLATVPDLAVAPAANSIRIICGDFNIDAATPADYLAGYGALALLGYTPQLGTAGASLLNPPPPTFFETGNIAPNNYLSALSLDNFLTWDVGRPPIGAWVINRVTGAPGPWITDMANTLAAINLLPAGAPRTQAFRSWANFGHIGNRYHTVNMAGVRGASDHLPLMLQI